MIIKDYVINHDSDEKILISFTIENNNDQFVIVIQNNRFGVVTWCHRKYNEKLQTLSNLTSLWNEEDKNKLSDFVHSQINMLYIYLRDTQEKDWIPLDTTMKDEDLQRILDDFSTITEDEPRDLSDFRLCTRNNKKYLAVQVTKDNIYAISAHSRYIFPVYFGSAFICADNTMASVPCYIVLEVTQDTLEPTAINCLFESDFKSDYKWLETV